MVSVMGSTLAAGGTYVAEEVFEPAAALATIARERINEWYGFPTQTAAVAEHSVWPAADLSSMTRTQGDREDTRLNSSHNCASRMPSSAWKKKRQIHIHDGIFELS